MNQNFTPDQLIKLCKKIELDAEGKNKYQFKSDLEVPYQQLISGSFNFSFQQSPSYYHTASIFDKLILRKLNDNIKRVYKVEQANRNIIIHQIKVLLEDECTTWVLKTDIKAFYESIDKSKLLAKLKNDLILSFHSVKILEQVLKINNDSNIGLPRGVNISATLSELFMRKFDTWVRRYTGVYFYARFVDDIVVFANTKADIERLQNQIADELFSQTGLLINKKKTSIFDANNLTPLNPLQYLGYKFIKSEKNKVIISIATKKVRKIKTRIVSAILDYVKNKDFTLLEKRVKFLTGNYSVKTALDGSNLKAGIYYNYANVNNPTIFEELTQFYRNIINSHSSTFGKKLSAKLSAEQRAKLIKYCFAHGFKKRSYYYFKATELKQLKKCWS